MNLAKGDETASGLPNRPRSANHDQACTEDQGERGREPPRSTRLNDWARKPFKSLLARIGKVSNSQIKQQEQAVDAGVGASSASKVLTSQITQHKQTVKSSVGASSAFVVPTSHNKQQEQLDNSGEGAFSASKVPEKQLHSSARSRNSGDEGSTSKTCLEAAIEQINFKSPGLQLASDDNNAKIAQRISEQLKYLKKSQTRTKNVVQNTIRYILVFKGLANSFTAFDPTKGSRIVVGGLYGILETILQSTNLDEQKIQDIDTVASKLAYWANIEKLYLNTQQSKVASYLEELRCSIVELYTKFLNMERLVLFKKRNNVFDHLGAVAKAPTEAPNWAKLINEFRVSQSNCETKLSILKDSLGKRKDILEWLSAADPLSEHEKILQRTHVADNYQQCGEWLLETQEYVDWASEDYSKTDSVLWLRGTVGTGKTTVLARVINWHLERSSQFLEHRFAYAYCSRAQALDSKTSYIAILRSLLRQASFNQLTGECPDNIVAFFNDRSQSGKAAPLEIVSHILEQLTAILLAGVRLRVMIDALDECDAPILLLEALAKLYQETPKNLEILMTSRHEVMVKDIDTFGHCREINLNTFLTRADMENFINLEVRGREKHSRLLKGEHPDLENRLIKVLEMKAGGMFRWVQLQLSLFLANNKLNHPKDVEKKLALLEAGSVAGVEELNQAYADVFKRNTPQGDIEKGHAVKLYKILLCRKDGLTAAALAEALAFDENEAEHWMYDDIWEMADIDKKVMDSTVTGAYVLGLCRDFVTEFDDDSLDFAHISVKDYLQGEGTGSLPEDQFSTAHCTQQMAKLCLRYFITRNEEPPIAPAGWRSPTHNFMFYAWERLGEHCSELSKELRVESGITADLVNWMQVAKGRNPFTNFLKLGRSHMASLLNHVLQSDSNSAIFAACAWNLVEVVESLIVTYPGYINLRNVQDSTPLYLACWLGRAQVVELLLDLDLADVEGIGTSGSALDCSALHGASDPAIAQLLLTKYPELVHSVDSLGRTPLFETQHSWEWAALLVKVYLENGANVDATDNDGETALHVNLSNPEATRVLAEKAKADARDKQGRTPLHIAAENALLPAVQILTRRTTVDLADDGGMTALLHAAANDMDEDGYIETIEHLLGFGASISSTNSEGQGVVHLAENSRVVEYFLRSDAHARNPRDQLDAKDKDGDTPILLAARFTMVAKMMTLIEAGADVKEKNNAGQNSLHLIMGDAKVNFPSDASYASHFLKHELEIATIVQALISRGCDIKHKDKDGNQPIHYIFGSEANYNASSNDILARMPFVKCKLACLVEAGVSVTCPDKEDKTFIDHFLSYLKHHERHIMEELDAPFNHDFVTGLPNLLSFVEHCLKLQGSSTSTSSAMGEIGQIIERLEARKLELTVVSSDESSEVFSWNDSVEWPNDWPRYDIHVL